MEPRKNIRIGDVLKEFGYVTDEQIGEAIQYQKTHEGLRLGGALIEMGLITEHQMLEALGRRLDYQVVSIADLSIDIKSVGLIPQGMAENYQMMAYKQEDGLLYVLTNDPLNFYGLEDIRQVAGMDIMLSLTEAAPLADAIQYYYAEVTAHRMAEAASKDSAPEEEIVDINIEDAEDDTPIINLLNSLIVRAYNTNVSDIHIEPFENFTTVRMRMDGVIQDYMTVQKNIHSSLIARIKILGDMDIAERRIPQDGHFRSMVDGTPINIRASVIPTVFGGKVNICDAIYR